MSQAQILKRGQVIRTSYNTGPYLVTSVSGPCACPKYVRSLNDGAPDSEQHYHLTCKRQDQPKQGDYWLNGYRLDGTSVWSDDRLVVVGEALGKMELFS